MKQWLKKQNIDLIFVPVPEMTEVYPDRVAGYVPGERMVSPQVRRLLFGLLKADVQVVDLLPLFLAAREESAEPFLYVPDDPHWSTRAQPIAARAIAERLRRYPFIKSSLAKPAMFREQKISKRVTGVWRQALKPYQLQRIQFFSLVTTFQVVTLLQKQPFQAVQSSPVMLMGDSYCAAMNAMVAPGTAVDAYLSKEIYCR